MTVSGFTAVPASSRCNTQVWTSCCSPTPSFLRSRWVSFASCVLDKVGWVGVACVLPVWFVIANYRAAVAALFWVALHKLRQRPARPRSCSVSPRERAKSLDWARCGRWVQWFLEFYELPVWAGVPVCVDHGSDIVYPHAELARLTRAARDDCGVADGLGGGSGACPSNTTRTYRNLKRKTASE